MWKKTNNQNNRILFEIDDRIYEVYEFYHSNQEDIDCFLDIHKYDSDILEEVEKSFRFYNHEIIDLNDYSDEELDGVLDDYYHNYIDKYDVFDLYEIIVNKLFES